MFSPPAVMMNGALAIDLRTDERFHRHQYVTEDAVKILAAFREVDLEPCVYVDHPDVDVFVERRYVVQLLANLLENASNMFA
jgi:hypothetical protein